MKVVLKVSRAGTNFAHDAGTEVDVSVEEAGRLFVTGQCSIANEQDRQAALDAVGDWNSGMPWPPVAAAAAVAGTGTTTDGSDDDDAPALNGDEAPADGGKQTAIQKAKAKKAQADAAKAA